ncbi:Ran-specific GTPase-activating protein 30 [Collariella sp. IMI 366227]|nr:Ran-specific GTPase-activating protein 30 [Collariella sp. IMI 366227]
MDALLQTLGIQTFNYVVRSGIALTSKYAVQQCTRLLKSVNDKTVRTELKALQNLLENKIKRLENAATAEEDARRQGCSGRVSDEHHAELLLIINDIKGLLGCIDRDVPLLQLAITASGEKMSSTMPPGISPSRMMQASALLSFADAHFVMDPARPLQAATAPPGHPDGYSYYLEIIEDLDDGRLHDGDGPVPRPYNDIPMAGIRESIPIHQVSKIFYTDTGRILNIGTNDERDNNPVLLLKRDLSAKTPSKMREEWFEEPETEPSDESQSDSSDNSLGSHDQEDIDRQLCEETNQAAKLPCHEEGPRTTYLPAHLDPEWLALEVFAEGDDEEDEEGEEDEGVGDGSDHVNPQTALTTRPQSPRNRLSVDSKLVAQMRRISLRGESLPKDPINQPSTDLIKTQQQTAEPYVVRSPFGAIATSLSLLEMLVRLTSLQEFQQTSHLAIPDHILTFFLEETSTTGLQGEAHWRTRTEAKKRMGFDPYSDAVPTGRVAE